MKFKKIRIIDAHSISNLKKFLYIVWYHYKKQWEIAVILMLAGALLKLPMPLLTQYIIDKVLILKDFKLLISLCVLLIIASLVYLGIDNLKDFLLFKVRNALTIRYNTLLLKHISSLPNQYLFKKESGYLMARILNDPNELSTIFIDSSLTLIQSSLVFIVSLVVIFFLNWKLSLVILAIIPLYIFSQLLFIEKIKFWNEKYKEQNAVVYKNLKETLVGIPTIKLFLLEPFVLLKFHKNLTIKYNYTLKEYKLELLSSIIISIISSLVPIIILGFGGYQIIIGEFTIGGLIAFSTLIGYLFSPIRAILNTHISFQTSLVSLNRIYEILNFKQKEDIENSTKKFSGKYDIVFDNVSFNYEDRNTIIKDFTLHIKENQKIGIIGPIGSGKTTIINLLNKAIQPKKGRILLGGVEINKFDKWIYNSIIGVVTQDVFLFSDTIFQNIKIGNIHATDEEVFDIARLCFIDEFALNLPDGYNTIIGESGVFLSGGQKQLLSFARVLIRKPKVLILDEPTSSIDQKTEILINQILSQFKGRCSIIIISHKNTLIEDADCILTCKEGKFDFLERKNYNTWTN